MKKKFLSILLACSVNINVFSFLSSADVIIDGSHRIDKATIMSYIGDTDTTDIDVNNLVKTLFATGLFGDVDVRFYGSKLFIKVKENPIINQIAFEGNKAVKDSLLRAEIGIASRDIYTKAKLGKALEKIVTIYKTHNGMFSTKIEPKLIHLPNNRVNIIFEIKEGARARIKRINFLGNKHVAAQVLRRHIYSSKTGMLSFLIKDDTYVDDKVDADITKIVRFYGTKGYLNAEVTAGFSELRPDTSNFMLNFVIKEGVRYRIGKIDVSAEQNDINTKKFLRNIKIKKNHWFNIEKIEFEVEHIRNALGEIGHPFADATFVTHQRDGGVVDIEFKIFEAPKVFIRSIKIINNDITLDRVIRRQLLVHEGDALNMGLLAKSLRNVRNLGFFKKVDFRKDPTEEKDKIDLIIAVEEDRKGGLEIAATMSGGFNPGAKFEYTNPNYRGRGQDIKFGVMFAKNIKEWNLGFMEPSFLGSDIGLGMSLERTTSDRGNTAGYKELRRGFSVYTTYSMLDNIQHTVTYALDRTKITSSQASTGKINDSTKKFNRGQYSLAGQLDKDLWCSSVENNLKLANVDSRFYTKSGYILSYDNKYSGVGGDVQYISNQVGSKFFMPMFAESNVAFKVRGGIMSQWGDNKRVVDRFALGYMSFRGFKLYGVGPRDLDTDNPWGGKKFYAGSLEFITPIPFGKAVKLRGVLFTDFGSLWDSGEQPRLASSRRIGNFFEEEFGSKDEHYYRQSVGFGMEFDLPLLGVCSVFLGWPVRYAGYDQKEWFQIKMGPA